MGAAINNFETVSVIIPVYNRMDELEKCLTSLVDARKFLNSAGMESEIVIVNDGGKKSEEIELLSARYPDTVYILQAKRVGAARAKNIGAARAKGNYLLFMDSDTESTNPQFIKNMVDFLKNDPHFGIVGGEFRNNRGDENWIVPSRQLGKNGTIIVEKVVEGTVAETEWISSSNLMIGRNLFLTIGGYFEKMFYLYEDAELCAAARKLEYATGTATMFAVRHYKSSRGRNSLLSSVLDERNKYLYVYMRENFGQSLRTIGYSLSDFGAGKRYILIIPSLLSFILLMPFAFLRKRKLNKLKMPRNNVRNQ